MATTTEISEQLTAFEAKVVITWSMYTGKLLETGENLKVVITIDEPLENCLSFSPSIASGSDTQEFANDASYYACFRENQSEKGENESEK
ncbi:putative 4CL3 [Sesbania bispinosa]|nr:putative 4CL3 [Sesbania bispinosa]